MRVQPLIRVGGTDPAAVLACADCGWTPPGSWSSVSTTALLADVVDHWAGAHEDDGGAAWRGLLHVDRAAPLIVSCKACGGVSELCLDGMIPTKVLEHWFTEHWVRPDRGAGTTSW